MTVRRDRKRGRRREVTYVTIAHNIREDRGVKKKHPKPVVFSNLGREKDVDPELAEAMAAAMDTFLELRWQMEKKRNPEAKKSDLVEVAAQEFQFPARQAQLRILTSRDFGFRYVLEPIWEELGLKAAFERYESIHRLKFPLERLVFGLVLNRLVDPNSKRAFNHWLENEAYFPEWDGWDVQHFYRALDVLHEHWDEVEQELFCALYERLPEEDRENGLLLADTTSLYFASKHTDDDYAEYDALWSAHDADEAERPKFRRPQVVNEPSLRLHGKNKDGHPGEPQVVLASLATSSGIVLRHKVYPGNTNDQTVARDLIDNLGPPEEMGRVWVSDNGMVNRKLLESLDESGWYRLSAEAVRKSKFARERILSHPGRYAQHPTRKHMSFKAFDVEAELLGTRVPELWIVVRNEKQQASQLRKIDRHLVRVKEALASQSRDGVHGKAVCEVVTHKSLKRYVKPSARGKARYILDQDAIRRERRLAGTRLYRTTAIGWTPEGTLDAYWALQQIERNHRELKGPLRLRPCYHRSERRIRAHVMITVLAANCARILEQRSGRTFADLVKDLKLLKAQLVNDGDKVFWQRTELRQEQKEVFTALGVKPPPLTWSRRSTAPTEAG